MYGGYRPTERAIGGHDHTAGYTMASNTVGYRVATNRHGWLQGGYKQTQLALDTVGERMAIDVANVCLQSWV